MPKGEYFRTEEHRQRIRDGKRGKWDRMPLERRKQIAERIGKRIRELWEDPCGPFAAIIERSRRSR